MIESVYHQTCGMFLRKLKAATTGRMQLSTDGLGAYTLGVPFTLRDRIDFGQLIKNYGGGNSTGRYSPARLRSAEKKAVFGKPRPRPGLHEPYRAAEPHATDECAPVHPPNERSLQEPKTSFSYAIYLLCVV